MQVLQTEKMCPVGKFKLSCVYTVSQEIEVTFLFPAIYFKGKNKLPKDCLHGIFFFSQDESIGQQSIGNFRRGGLRMKNILNEKG